MSNSEYQNFEESMLSLHNGAKETLRQDLLTLRRLMHKIDSEAPGSRRQCELIVNEINLAAELVFRTAIRVGDSRPVDF